MIRDKKAFTLVELLAVIVVLAIVMALTVVSITNVLTDTRRTAFSAEAGNLIGAARELLEGAESILNENVSALAPNCDITPKRETVYLTLASLTNATISKSPYGNKYTVGTASTVAATAPPSDKKTSYIKITTASDCSKWTYSIFLYDGVYAVGTPDAPVEFSEIDADKVKVYNAG